MALPVDIHGRRSLAFASAYATVAAIAGYAPGFLVPLAIASVFGANAGTDAFFLALSVASLIANALGTTTQQAAIPFLISARTERVDVGHYIGEISAALLLIAAVPVVVFDAGVFSYVRYRAGWPAEQQKVLFTFLCALAPYVVCAVLAGVYSGALNADHKYGRVAASPAMRSLVILVAVLLTPMFGVYALAAGYVLGEGARLGYLIGQTARRNRVRLLAWPRAASMPEFSRTAVAQMLGSGVLAFLPLLDRTMTTRLGAGSVSLLDYADRLWQVPLSLAASGFMVTSLAHWSERLYEGGTIRDLSRDTARVAWIGFAVFVPICAVFVLLRQPIVSTLFSISRFSATELHTLTDTLALFVIVTPIYIAGLVYSRAFLVLKRSDWLLAIAVVDLCIKVPLNTSLIQPYGVVGIALSTALTYTASSVLLVLIFHWLARADAVRIAAGALTNG